MNHLPQHTDIAVASASPDLFEKASALAQSLSLPILMPNDTSVPILLVLTEERLELRYTGPRAPGPVFVDFTGPSMSYRRLKGGGRQEALAKAIGLKKKRHPNVFDATAGLGRDAFILASLGCTVVMAERSLILAALLEDGLQRARQNLSTREVVEKRLSLIQGNAVDIIRQGRLPFAPEVIYLDPMHPAREKTALVKKEMRILRDVVGKDLDDTELLHAALNHAPSRIVVKRPRKAPAIEGPRPSYVLDGKSSRYDIYLP